MNALTYKNSFFLILIIFEIKLVILSNNLTPIQTQRNERTQLPSPLKLLGAINYPPTFQINKWHFSPTDPGPNASKSPIFI